MKIDTLFIDKTIPLDMELNYLISQINAEPQWVDDSKTVYDFINKADDPVLKAKSTLYVTKNKGAVVKECPGTSYYTCCDYTILHTGTFCTMDCSYCILQAYFHPPVLQYFAGLETLDHALEKTFSQNKIFRIGTGEYTDSLIWEKVSLVPKFLVEKFARQNNCLLELKTKTVNIDSLLPLDHNGKTVLAWSLNTPDIISSEEKGTASLKARFEAARQAESKGYRLAFHFDPLVIYPGCEIEYKKVIQQIFEYVSSQSIVWISIGTFRFMPKLKQLIETRFKQSTICYGEFILGLDNKMRYFKPLRIKLYKEIISCIKEYAPDLLVYFCMEDEEVWEKCMGFFPAKEGELGHMLDKSAVSHCDLNYNLL
ncbi:SPL family radical SAM protein [Desulfobacula toluolica]|uniref:DNA repair photolyase-like protein n=1 Tax=Desulfobacula toluolica (strain DSM 7467 / Tol2) TaxID=651182 RepID=K0NN62_DESTT|nr:deoxyribodipyrimidine photo-lyase [Desulfobacula toluolica]CCK80147.1 DNA repair photolyase-like protein [Desulfobacula toluolica Tol2]